MNKEEIKHFKAMLRQGLLRHRDILLNKEFQKELLNIIKDYEKLQQENKELHNKIDKAIELNGKIDKSLRMKNTSAYIELEDIIFEQWKILKDSDVDE